MYFVPTDISVIHHLNGGSNSSSSIYFILFFCLKKPVSFHAINDLTHCFSDVGFNLGDVSSVLSVSISAMSVSSTMLVSVDFNLMGGVTFNRLV